MKICYIASAQSYIIQQWVEWFANREHEVHLISHKLSFNVPKVLKNVYLHELNLNDYSGILKILPFKSIWQTISLCRKIIKEIDPDIVHGHIITNLGGLPTVFSGDYPKVVSAWGSDILISSKKSIKYMLIVKYVLKRVDIIHSFAENLTKEMILYGANKENICTISPCTDTKNFTPYIDGSEIRKLLGWENNPIVISIRSFEPIYNIECLINAIPIVLDEISDAKFIIKGKGSLENKLKSMVKELGISSSVKFIGYVEYGELPKYLSCADVYVSTSLSDGLGISNIEALACGTPAVLANIDSTRNLIKKGLNARLYPPKNSNALAKEIIASIKNKEKKDKEIHKENFRIIKEHYDFNKNMEKIEQLYEKLIYKYKKMKR